MTDKEAGELSEDDDDRSCGGSASTGDASIFHWCSKTLSKAEVSAFFKAFWAGQKEAVPEELLCLNHCLSCIHEYHQDRKTVVEGGGSKQVEGVLFTFECSLLSHFLTCLKHRLAIRKQRKKLSTNEQSPNRRHQLPIVLRHILKYPFFLFLKDLHDLFVEVLVECLSEDESISVSQLPGVYLLLIHPNKKLHTWAKEALRAFSPIQLGDSSDLLRVVNLILSVLKFDLQSDPILCDSLGLDEPSRRIIVMSHIFSMNVYWQGLHTLLNHMDTALMGNVHGEIPLTILNSLLQAAKSSTPECDFFLQKLLCFSVLLKSFQEEIWFRVARSQEDVFVKIIKCKIWSGLIKKMGRVPHARSSLSEHFGWIEHWAGSLIGQPENKEFQIRHCSVYIYHVLHLVQHQLAHLVPSSGARHCRGPSECPFRIDERGLNRMRFMDAEKQHIKGVVNLKNLCKIWMHLQASVGREAKRTLLSPSLKLGLAGFVPYEDVVCIVSPRFQRYLSDVPGASNREGAAEMLLHGKRPSQGSSSHPKPASRNRLVVAGMKHRSKKGGVPPVRHEKGNGDEYRRSQNPPARKDSGDRSCDKDEPRGSDAHRKCQNPPGRRDSGKNETRDGDGYRKCQNTSGRRDGEETGTRGSDAHRKGQYPPWRGDDDKDRGKGSKHPGVTRLKSVTTPSPSSETNPISSRSLAQKRSLPRTFEEAFRDSVERERTTDSPSRQHEDEGLETDIISPAQKSARLNVVTGGERLKIRQGAGVEGRAAEPMEKRDGGLSKPPGNRSDYFPDERAKDSSRKFAKKSTSWAGANTTATSGTTAGREDSVVRSDGVAQERAKKLSRKFAKKSTSRAGANTTAASSSTASGCQEDSEANSFSRLLQVLQIDRGRKKFPSHGRKQGSQSVRQKETIPENAPRGSHVSGPPPEAGLDSSIGERDERVKKFPRLRTVLLDRYGRPHPKDVMRLNIRDCSVSLKQISFTPEATTETEPGEQEQELAPPRKKMRRLASYSDSSDQEDTDDSFTLSPRSNDPSLSSIPEASGGDLTNKGSDKKRDSSVPSEQAGMQKEGCVVSLVESSGDEAAVVPTTSESEMQPPDITEESNDKEDDPESEKGLCSEPPPLVPVEKNVVETTEGGDSVSVAENDRNEGAEEVDAEDDSEGSEGGLAGDAEPPAADAKLEGGGDGESSDDDILEVEVIKKEILSYVISSDEEGEGDQGETKEPEKETPAKFTEAVGQRIAQLLSPPPQSEERNTETIGMASQSVSNGGRANMSEVLPQTIEHQEDTAPESRPVSRDEVSSQVTERRKDPTPRSKPVFGQEPSGRGRNRKAGGSARKGGGVVVREALSIGRGTLGKDLLGNTVDQLKDWLAGLNNKKSAGMLEEESLYRIGARNPAPVDKAPESVSNAIGTNLSEVPPQAIERRNDEAPKSGPVPHSGTVVSGRSMGVTHTMSNDGSVTSGKKGKGKCNPQTCWACRRLGGKHDVNVPSVVDVEQREAVAANAREENIGPDVERMESGTRGGQLHGKRKQQLEDDVPAQGSDQGEGDEGRMDFTEEEIEEIERQLSGIDDGWVVEKVRVVKDAEGQGSVSSESDNDNEDDSRCQERVAIEADEGEREEDGGDDDDDEDFLDFLGEEGDPWGSRSAPVEDEGDISDGLDLSEIMDHIERFVGSGSSAQMGGKTGKPAEKQPTFARMKSVPVGSGAKPKVVARHSTIAPTSEQTDIPIGDDTRETGTEIEGVTRTICEADEQRKDQIGKKGKTTGEKDRQAEGQIENGRKDQKEHFLLNLLEIGSSEEDEDESSEAGGGWMTGDDEDDDNVVTIAGVEELDVDDEGWVSSEVADGEEEYDEEGWECSQGFSPMDEEISVEEQRHKVQTTHVTGDSKENEEEQSQGFSLTEEDVFVEERRHKVPTGHVAAGKSKKSDESKAGKDSSKSFSKGGWLTDSSDDSSTGPKSFQSNSFYKARSPKKKKKSSQKKKPEPAKRPHGYITGPSAHQKRIQRRWSVHQEMSKNAVPLGRQSLVTGQKSKTQEPATIQTEEQPMAEAGGTEDGRLAPTVKSSGYRSGRSKALIESLIEAEGQKVGNVRSFPRNRRPQQPSKLPLKNTRKDDHTYSMSDETAAKDPVPASADPRKHVRFNVPARQPLKPIVRTSHFTERDPSLKSAGESRDPETTKGTASNGPTRSLSSWATAFTNIPDTTARKSAPPRRNSDVLSGILKASSKTQKDLRQGRQRPILKTLSEEGKSMPSTSSSSFSKVVQCHPANEQPGHTANNRERVYPNGPSSSSKTVTVRISGKDGRDNCSKAVQSHPANKQPGQTADNGEKDDPREPSSPIKVVTVRISGKDGRDNTPSTAHSVLDPGQLLDAQGSSSNQQPHPTVTVHTTPMPETSTEGSARQRGSPEKRPARIYPSKPLMADQFLGWILSWNVNHMTEKVSRDPAKILEGCDYKTIYEVTNSFRSIDQYYATFLPLKMVQIWNDVRRSYTRSENESRISTAVLSESALWMFEGKMYRKCCFKISVPTTSPEEPLPLDKYPQKCDLIVIKPDNTDTFEPIFGYVEEIVVSTAAAFYSNRKSSELSVMVRILGDTDFKSHCVQLLPLTSLASYIQQFLAFCMLPKSSVLTPSVLNPTRKDVFSMEDVRPLNSSIYKEIYNTKEQENFIRGAFHCIQESYGLPRICLLQGPPCSGKTRTLTSLVACLLRHSAQVRAPPSSVKPKILLCAPNETALDAIHAALWKTIRRDKTERNMRADTPEELPFFVLRLGEVQHVTSKYQHFVMGKIVSDMTAKCDNNIKALKTKIGELEMHLQSLDSKIQYNRSSNQDLNGTNRRYSDSVGDTSPDAIPLEKEGVLSKLQLTENGKRVKQKWVPYYTTLNGPKLSFYKDTKNYEKGGNKTSPTGPPESTFELYGAELRWPKNERAKLGKKYAFELSLPTNEILVQSETEVECLQWFQAIHNEICALVGNLKSERIHVQQRRQEAQEKLEREEKWRTDFKEEDARADILAQAEVICCKLNDISSPELQMALRRPSHDPLKVTFSCAIIDEACQCLEVDTILPLYSTITKLVMAGDPHELKHKTIPQISRRSKLTQSLFTRLWMNFQRSARRPVQMLTEQHVCHPAIFSFPNRTFYNNRIYNSRSAQEKEDEFVMSPYLVFNLLDSQEVETPDGDFSNEAEADLVQGIMGCIKQQKFSSIAVAIVSPYPEQVNLLKQRFGSPPGLYIGDIEGLQGKNKDIVIMSCVRTEASTKNLGFLDDHNKLNVALTRASFSMFIIGNFDALPAINTLWSNLLEDARHRELYTKIENVKTRKQVQQPLLQNCIKENLQSYNRLRRERGITPNT